MKIKLSASLFGYSVGGYDHEEEIEIGEEVKGMSEEEMEDYIENVVEEYILDSIEWGWEIEEEDEEE